MDFPHELIRLKALLGANGVLTNKLQNSLEVASVCVNLFGIDETTDLFEVQQRVIDLGRPLRQVRVRQNLGNLPARLVSVKGKNNKDRRNGRLRKKDKRVLASMAVR